MSLKVHKRTGRLYRALVLHPDRKKTTRLSYSRGATVAHMLKRTGVTCDDVTHGTTWMKHGDPLPCTGNSTALICLQNSPCLTVKTLAGKSISFPFGVGDCTVADIKEKIERKEGTPPSMQRLIWNNRALADKKTLREYGVPPVATFYMVLALRGGMFHQTSGRLDGAEPVPVSVRISSDPVRTLDVGVNLDTDTPLSLFAMLAGDLSDISGEDRQWEMYVNGDKHRMVSLADDTTSLARCGVTPRSMVAVVAVPKAAAQ